MSIDYRNSEAPISTITLDKDKIDAKTGNIYEAISIISKRSAQIGSEMKKELLEKMDEFAMHNDSLEEAFENREQIDVSKCDERLPTPHAFDSEAVLDDNLSYRNTIASEDK